MLLKKILASSYRKIKLPFSILKTKLLMLKINLINDNDYKSASDNGEYPELALKAALDPATFSVFRRHHKYTGILEHVSRKEGEQYLNIIREKYKIKDDEILEHLYFALGKAYEDLKEYKKSFEKHIKNMFLKNC